MAAGAANIRAGGAFVELFTKNGKLDAGLARASAKLKAWGASVGAMGRQLAGVGLMMAAPFALAVKLASDSTEVLNKFNEVFGSQAPQATAFINDLVSAAGRSRVEMLNGLAAFQGMLRGLGFGAERARAMSQELQQLAVDFGSFHNISDAEAMQRFISAMAGSVQVLDMFGINARESALDQEFLALGMQVTTRTATEQQKAIARLAVIRRAMGQQGAIGDAVRTAGSFANQLKRLRGIALDTGATIGEALIPTLTKIVGWMGTGMNAVAAFAKDNQALILILGGAAAGLTIIGVGMMALGPAISALGMGLGILKLAFVALKVVAALAWAVVAGPWVAVIGAAVAGAVIALGHFSGAFGRIGEGFSELGGIASTTFGGISDAIATGDWAGAMEIAGLGLVAVWETIIGKLKAVWNDFERLFTHGALAGMIASWTADLQINAALAEGAEPIMTPFGWATPTNQPFVPGVVAPDPMAPANEAIAALNRRRAQAADNRIVAEWMATEQLDSMAQQAAANAAKTLGKTDSSGTFSAFAANALGSNNLAERTAKATEESADSLKELKRRPGGFPIT